MQKRLVYDDGREIILNEKLVYYFDEDANHYTKHNMPNDKNIVFIVYFRKGKWFFEDISDIGLTKH